MIPPFATGEAKAERCFSSPCFEKAAQTFGGLGVRMLTMKSQEACLPQWIQSLHFTEATTQLGIISSLMNQL